MNTVVFRKSYFLKVKIEPEVVYDELERIRVKSGGKLEPNNVVEESEPKTATLHDFFEWRNAIAAKHYRDWQARNLIKSIRIIKTDHEGLQQEEPSYVHIKNLNDEGKVENYYQATHVAVQHVNEWVSAVSNAELKLNAARRAVEDLERIARGSDDSDRLARLTIAAKAIDTAWEAIRH